MSTAFAAAAATAAAPTTPTSSTSPSASSSVPVTVPNSEKPAAVSVKAATSGTTLAAVTPAAPTVVATVTAAAITIPITTATASVLTPTLNTTTDTPTHSQAPSTNTSTTIATAVNYPNPPKVLPNILPEEFQPNSERPRRRYSLECLYAMNIGNAYDQYIIRPNTPICDAITPRTPRSSCSPATTYSMKPTTPGGVTSLTSPTTKRSSGTAGISAGVGQNMAAGMSTSTSSNSPPLTATSTSTNAAQPNNNNSKYNSMNSPYFYPAFIPGTTRQQRLWHGGNQVWQYDRNYPYNQSYGSQYSGNLPSLLSMSYEAQQQYNQQRFFYPAYYQQQSYYSQNPRSSPPSTNPTSPHSSSATAEQQEVDQQLQQQPKNENDVSSMEQDKPPHPSSSPTQWRYNVRSGRERIGSGRTQTEANSVGYNSNVSLFSSSGNTNQSGISIGMGSNQFRSYETQTYYNSASTVGGSGAAAIGNGGSGAAAVVSGSAPPSCPSPSTANGAGGGVRYKQYDPVRKYQNICNNNNNVSSNYSNNNSNNGGNISNPGNSTVSNHNQSNTANANTNNGSSKTNNSNNLGKHIHHQRTKKSRKANGSQSSSSSSGKSSIMPPQKKTTNSNPINPSDDCKNSKSPAIEESHAVFIPATMKSDASSAAPEMLTLNSTMVTYSTSSLNNYNNNGSNNNNNNGIFLAPGAQQSYRQYSNRSYRNRRFCPDELQQYQLQQHQQQQQQQQQSSQASVSAFAIPNKPSQQNYHNPLTKVIENNNHPANGVPTMGIGPRGFSSTSLVSNNGIGLGGPGSVAAGGGGVAPTVAVAAGLNSINYKRQRQHSRYYTSRQHDPQQYYNRNFVCYNSSMMTSAAATSLPGYNGNYSTAGGAFVPISANEFSIYRNESIDIPRSVSEGECSGIATPISSNDESESEIYPARKKPSGSSSVSSTSSLSSTSLLSMVRAITYECVAKATGVKLPPLDGPNLVPFGDIGLLHEYEANLRRRNGYFRAAHEAAHHQAHNYNYSCEPEMMQHYWHSTMEPPSNASFVSSEHDDGMHDIRGASSNSAAAFYYADPTMMVSHGMPNINPSEPEDDSFLFLSDLYGFTPPDRFLARAHLVETKVAPPELLNNSRWDKLSQSVWDKFIQAQQTEKVYKLKMRLWRYIHIVIKHKYPRYGLYLVGSSISGFGTNASDIDMCMLARTNPNVDPRMEAVYHLQMMRECLDKSGEFDEFNLIEARVPILRFMDSLHKVEVDINFNNSVGIRNTHLLYCYSQLEWRLRPLILVVKQWARYHNINNAKSMTISSYSLVLMVIHFLQFGVNPPVLPCLHAMYPDKFTLLRPNDFGYVDMNEKMEPFHSCNRQSIGELLVEFLRYYTYFDFMKFAISIRVGAILPIDSCRSAKAAKNDIHQWNELCIEEPFDQTNTARSVYDAETFERIKAIFAASWKQLDQSHNLNSIFTAYQGPRIVTTTDSECESEGVFSPFEESSSSTEHLIPKKKVRSKRSVPVADKSTFTEKCSGTIEKLNARYEKNCTELPHTVAIEMVQEMSVGLEMAEKTSSNAHELYHQNMQESKATDGESVAEPLEITCRKSDSPTKSDAEESLSLNTLIVKENLQSIDVIEEKGESLELTN